jgi:hypothetical protein
VQGLYCINIAYRNSARKGHTNTYYRGGVFAKMPAARAASVLGRLAWAGSCARGPLLQVGRAGLFSLLFRVD